MRRRKQKVWFEVQDAIYKRPVRVLANNAGQAMHLYRKQTGARNFGSTREGGWEGYHVQLAKVQ